MDDRPHYRPPELSRHQDFYALYVVQRGQGQHVIDGVSYAVARGDVYVMGLGATHCYTRCHDLLVQGFYFPPALFDAAAREALIAIPGVPSLIPGWTGEDGVTGRTGRWLHLTPTAYEQALDQMEKLNEEWELRRPGCELMLRNLFLGLLIQLARSRVEAHPRPPAIKETGHMRAVIRAIEEMEERYAEDVRIEQIAATVFLSRGRFASIFFEAVGQTPRDYLRHLRIECAKRLLETTNLSMTVIAGQSGLGASAYFSRVFRSAAGMTPGEYRRRTRGLG